VRVRDLYNKQFNFTRKVALIRWEYWIYLVPN
jgi:hypothetical protein